MHGDYCPLPAIGIAGEKWDELVLLFGDFDAVRDDCEEVGL
jgi:hypothetical protein